MGRIIYSYLVFRADAGFPCPAKYYYIPGNAFATSAHAAARKAIYLVRQNKLTFIPSH